MKNKTKSAYQRLIEELDKISASIEEIKKILKKGWFRDEKRFERLGEKSKRIWKNYV